MLNRVFDNRRRDATVLHLVQCVSRKLPLSDGGRRVANGLQRMIPKFKASVSAETPIPSWCWSTC